MDDILLESLFENSTDRKICVLIEPWADEFIVEPGDKLDLQVFGNAWGVLHTVVEQDHVAIWLWSGSRARVFLNGQDVTANSITVSVP